MSLRWTIHPIVATLLGLSCTFAVAQTIDEDQLGAWYILQWRADFQVNGWGLQGDVQHRNFDFAGDREQLLFRTGLARQFGKFRVAAGYAFVDTGTFGPSSRTRQENRLYQELRFATPVGKRLQFSHRFRFEQRWLESQDFRTRIRYGLFLNVPLTRNGEPTGSYLAFYDEIFLNGKRNIGGGRRVDYFDRNRIYAGIGRSISDRTRLQFVYMHQTTDNVDKAQLQLALNVRF